MNIKTRLALASLVVLPFFGCATTQTASQAPGDKFTGEVWTWDERENTVTLRQGAQDVRIKTTPDQMRGLQLHQTATIRGQVAPPADIVSTITPAGPMSAVPRGPVAQQTVSGTVTAVDPSGRLSIDSDRGPLHVWAAAGAHQRFAVGDRVQVLMAVQPVDMVPAAAGRPTTAADPSASLSVSSQPGDSAVVTGRVMGSDRGILVVESPSGPIQVWVGDSPRYTLSQPVQVRTNVSKAQ
jgi:outer membrane lipoprotein SlyB